jgi:putative aldouronate transport system permease protein
MKFKKQPKNVVVFNVIAYIVITIFTLLCIVPFIIIVSGSFTDNTSIAVDGYHLIPKVFSLDAYRTIFLFPKTILQAYKVTVVNTVVGTTLGLLFISMTGYVLSRKDFKYRNKVSFIIYFTTLFGGGLIPWYIMVNNTLKLHDSYLAICYPGLMTPFLIILMRTFISSTLPDEIIEAAKIDGAGNFKIYLSVVLPVIGPGLATVGLFLALNYWNDWFLSSLFMSTPSKYELQFYLYNMLNSSVALSQMMSGAGASVSGIKPPSESVKLAMTVVAIGPILLLYPFIQRYFVSGITVGAVKG